MLQAQWELQMLLPCFFPLNLKPTTKGHKVSITGPLSGPDMSPRREISFEETVESPSQILTESGDLVTM